MLKPRASHHVESRRLIRDGPQHVAMPELLERRIHLPASRHHRQVWRELAACAEIHAAEHYGPAVFVDKSDLAWSARRAEATRRRRLIPVRVERLQLCSRRLVRLRTRNDLERE